MPKVQCFLYHFYIYRKKKKKVRNKMQATVSVLSHTEKEKFQMAWPFIEDGHS